MGVVSRYASDDEVINSLRGYYDADRRFSVNFCHWLHTARKCKDGIIVQVENRRFLVDEFTGCVIREVN